MPRRSVPDLPRGVPEEENWRMKNIGQLLKQAQKMQGAMKKVQEELAAMRISASTGGGVVEVTASGNQEIIAVKIDPEVVNPEEVDLLEDLLIAAVNEALRKAGETAASEMKKVTGGLSLPGLF
jgi:DNA-binding YbaB/EbfC family protein